MLTLIRREIRDHIIYFIAAVVFSAILIALLTAATYNLDDLGGSTAFVGLSVPVLVILVLVGILIITFYLSLQMLTPNLKRNVIIMTPRIQPIARLMIIPPPPTQPAKLPIRNTN